MEKIIKNFQSHCLSGDDIMNICNNESKIITNSQLSKYRSIEEVLDPFGSAIILYDRKDGSPGHWSALIKQKDGIEFFCSYGMKMDEVTSVIGGKNNLTRLLRGYKYYSNPYKFQRKSSSISSCGRFIGFRILLRDMPLNSFAKMLLNNKNYDPDFWITCLTLFAEN